MVADNEKEPRFFIPDTVLLVGLLFCILLAIPVRAADDLWRVTRFTGKLVAHETRVWNTDRRDRARKRKDRKRR